MFDGPTIMTLNGDMTVEDRGGLRTNYTYDRKNRVSVEKISSDPEKRNGESYNHVL